MSTTWKHRTLSALLMLAVCIAYASHFENGFHFDDMHTVVTNPYIRDWRNIPKFFQTANTFSVEPSNRVYRPIISTTLAIDYWLAEGLRPFYFHLSTFLLYLLQLGVMFRLFRRIYDRSHPDPRNWYAAFLATAWFGLHPVSAETVNYIIQRGDLYDTLGVLSSVLLYAAYPRHRRFGLYLAPFILAVLSKPPALIFPAILFAYIWLFDEKGKFKTAVIRCLPAVVVTISLVILTTWMTPRGFMVKPQSPYAYRITQPLVALRYFQTFFLPGGLTADTDLTPIPSVWQDGAWIGFLFLFAVLAIIGFAWRKREWRPVAFGFLWFLLALAPTSLYPLGEVENDHRMFFPFAGLVLALVWPIALWVYRKPVHSTVLRVAFGAVCVVQLAMLGLATVQRNVVWHSEESLWRDVTIKSPQNARGWLNYGSTLVDKGEFEAALGPLARAKQLRPNYTLADLNLAVAKGKLGQDSEAIDYFESALNKSPGDVRYQYLYAKYLADQGEELEALRRLQIAAGINPDYLDTFYLAMKLRSQSLEWKDVLKVARYVHGRFPTDSVAKAYLLMAAHEGGFLTPDIRPLETADNYLNLAAVYYQNGKYEYVIRAAEQSLRIRPRHAEAYNNIAAASRALGDWDRAIQASNRAMQLKPDLAGARRNLELALKQDKGSL